jgi:hypothetical protein
VDEGDDSKSPTQIVCIKSEEKRATFGQLLAQKIKKTFGQL